MEQSFGLTFLIGLGVAIWLFFLFVVGLVVWKDPRWGSGPAPPADASGEKPGA